MRKKEGFTLREPKRKTYAWNRERKKDIYNEKK